MLYQQMHTCILVCICWYHIVYIYICMYLSGFISLLLPILDHVQEGLLFKLYSVKYDVTFP